MSTQHKTMNLDDAEDMAPKYGMGDMGQSRFLRRGLGADGIGLANYKMNPGRRIGFGHRHGECEEMYVVLAGSGRFKLDDEIVEVAARDVVYCPPSVMREWEAGPDGLELLAFGDHVEDDGEITRGWWTD
jgi:quercetin dioxygenase-like cupin family protein